MVRGIPSAFSSVAFAVFGVSLIAAFSGPREGALNVHLVAHTHDDVGWLKTVDQYFFGRNNSIQLASVQYILDSSIAALQENPKRRFVYVEMAYLYRWWKQQTEEMKSTVRNLVRRGQLSFLNGGWVMNDEATPTYFDMIDQQTLGADFIVKEFGPEFVPTIGWQPDPFGHSAFQATAYALMGMDAYFFGRIDLQDYAMRERTRTMETIQQGSQSLGKRSQVLAGAMHGYGPPVGFDFDSWSTDAPLQDDPTFGEFDIDLRVADFIGKCREQSNWYNHPNETTGHIMLTMGSDFQYSNAHAWFKNLDKLIKHVNVREDLKVADGFYKPGGPLPINVFYSTPKDYVDARDKQNRVWPVKSDDYFPYGDGQARSELVDNDPNDVRILADDTHAYWTGYFTSRPAFKKLVRDASNTLRISRVLSLLSPPSPTIGSHPDEELWHALAVAQHHDSIAGTAKQHVSDDYSKMLYGGMSKSREKMEALFAKFLEMRGTHVEFAERRNETRSSHVMASKLKEGEPSYAAVFNSLAQEISTPVRLPAPGRSKFVVLTDLHTQKQLRVEVVRSLASPDSHLFEVAFTATDLPPLGFKVFKIESVNGGNLKGSPATRVEMERRLQEETQTSAHYGTLENAEKNLKLNFEAYMASYEGSDGDTEEKKGQSSGAYIFRPKCPENDVEPCSPEPMAQSSGNRPSGKINNTPFNLKVRKIEELPGQYEVDWVVGPIDVNNTSGGREIVLVIKTDIENGSEKQPEFETDSNGRDWQKRKVNYRETWQWNNTDPVAANFYPVVSGIRISDGELKAQEGGRELTVFTDRAVAATSLRKGEIQLLVHRRLLVDDLRGVAEPLNEVECLEGEGCRGIIVRGTFRVLLDSKGSIESSRDMQNQILAPVEVFHVAREPDVTWGSLLSRSLPSPVHLLTAQFITARFDVCETNPCLLVRLAHSLELSEVTAETENVTVDLYDLFAGIRVTKVNEVTLNTGRPVESVEKIHWKTFGDEVGIQKDFGSRPDRISNFLSGNTRDGFSFETNRRSGRKSEFQRNTALTKVTISPMDIKTFLCDWEPVPHERTDAGELSNMPESFQFL